MAPSATSTTLPVNSREGARSPVSEAARVRRHRPVPEGRLAGPAPTALHLARQLAGFGTQYTPETVTDNSVAAEPMRHHEPSLP